MRHIRHVPVPSQNPVIQCRGFWSVLSLLESIVLPFFDYIHFFILRTGMRRIHECTETQTNQQIIESRLISSESFFTIIIVLNWPRCRKGMNKFVKNLIYTINNITEETMTRVLIRKLNVHICSIYLLLLCFYFFLSKNQFIYWNIYRKII